MPERHLFRRLLPSGLERSLGRLRSFDEEKTLLPYQYEALDSTKRQIRLLRLAPGKRHDPVRATLTVVELDDPDTNFDALSYLWGDPEPAFAIRIGDRWELQLPRNIHNALIDLRRRRAALVIWADAICINQRNNEEKGYQVQLMRDIYQRASVVRAWIDVDVDLDAMRKPCRKLAETPDKVHVNLEDGGTQFWFPMTEIFSNPYWRRLWVQQELILAKSIVIHCRQNTFVGEPVLKFQKSVMKLGILPNHYPVAYSLWKSCGDAPAFSYGILSAREEYWKLHDTVKNNNLKLSQTTNNMLDFFLNTYSLHCAEPRDRVYGLLGIMADVDLHHFVVDYSLSLPAVCGHLLNAFVRRYKSLMFLCYFAYEEGTCDEPTWMPSPAKEPSFRRVDIEVSNASGRVDTSRAPIHSNGLAITVQGLLVDRVLRLSPQQSLDGVPISTWAKWLEQLCLQSQILRRNLSLSTLDDVLFLCFPPWEDQTYLSIFGRQRPKREEQVRALEGLLHFCKTDEASTLSLYDIWQGTEGVLETASTEPELRSSMRSIADALINQRFFSTESKHLARIDYRSDIQPGDEIWVLFRCPMPIVLRPRPQQQGGYSWIGCAILPSLMEGEAVEGILETGEPGPDYSGPPIREITLW